MGKYQKLPIGIQSFRQIIIENFLYVDKTRYIFRLLESGRLYFLARPRRFGKSLLVSTLKCLFQGNGELFKDLWIHGHTNWEWKEHPVIVLDFNLIPHKSTEELKEELNNTLEEYGKKNNIQLESVRLIRRFRELIIKLRENTGKEVVVLVDEYDKPMIDFIGEESDKLKTAKDNRDLLREFYGVLKGDDVAGALRFVFITGVSKFSKVSIFSELNNLYDLTMQEKYNEMLGYTPEEMEKYFKSHIMTLGEKYRSDYTQLLGKINVWYNGYRFSDRDVSVYNPFSILLLLESLSFKNYWFETGTPEFLIKLLKNKNYSLPKLENIEITEDIFTSYDIDNLKIEAILFQTGYLTIKAVRNYIYILSYPNQEVKTSLLRHLFTSYSEIEDGSERSKFILLSEYLTNEDYDRFFKTLRGLYASIPYTLMQKADEGYFHSLFYLMICASGIEAHTEVLTSKGRIDMVIEFDSKLFIIEFKCNQSAEKGIRQIKQKKYYEKYLGAGKRIFLMGINFSTEEKSVIEWKVEKS